MRRDRGDGAEGIRHCRRLSALLRLKLPRQSTCAVARSRLRPRSAPMAIFELDGEAPDLPADGRYWIADRAIVIRRVRLKTDARVRFNAAPRCDNARIELRDRSQVPCNAA